MSSTKAPASAGGTAVTAAADDTMVAASAADAAMTAPTDAATVAAPVDVIKVPAPADGESTHRAPAPWDDPAAIGPAAWTAEVHGKHRMPQSSVRPAATALMSGLVSFLTGRRPVVSGARRVPVHAGNRHRQISA